jgi:formylmethanofuran dehydrogenase subunit E
MKIQPETEPTEELEACDGCGELFLSSDLSRTIHDGMLCRECLDELEVIRRDRPRIQ